MSLKLDIKKRKQNNSGITALIDGDILCYACGFSSQHNIHELYVSLEPTPRATFTSKKEMKKWVKENGLLDSDYCYTTRIEVEPVENALHSVKIFINDILEKTNAQYHKIFLTGKGNFRESVATILPYKGNRDNLHKPVHYAAIRDYLVNVWDAVVVEGMEADDMLAIEQTEALSISGYAEWASKGVCKLEDCSTVICSIDKDLKQVPGWHYNWNKDEAPVWIDEKTAMYNFYKQLLAGDMTDNIQGIPGIGPKKAEKILEGCETEWEIYTKVWGAYHEWVHGKYPDMTTADPKEVDSVLQENAHLIWMIRELDSEGNPIHWRPPYGS